MNEEFFLGLLSSSVLAAIITGILGLIVNSKRLTTDYISGERKSWREKIRQLSLQIQQAKNLESLRNSLLELKVYINAYGMLKATQYLLDGHLWKLIHEVEQIDDATNFKLELYKNSTIELLSVLLKYDWERSKLEVKGNSFIYGIIISNLWCAVLGLSANFYCFYLDNLEITSSMIYELASLTITLTLFCIGFLCCICKLLHYVFSQWGRTIPNKLLYGGMFLIILLNIYLTVDNCLSAPWAIQLIGKQYRTTAKFAITGAVISSVITVAYSLELCRSLITYKRAIQQIKHTYGLRL